MLRSRTIRIIALVLALIAGVAFVMGYDFVNGTNFIPKESTLSD